VSRTVAVIGSARLSPPDPRCLPAEQIGAAIAAQGWTLIGMTGHPEAVLARELAMCYTTLALVTDLDAGVEEGEGVTQAEVFDVFARNMSRLRDLVGEIIESFPGEREDDLCAHALDGIKLPFDLP